MLSTLGEKLLLWGLGISLNVKRERGTNVEIPSVSAEEIEEIVKGNVEKAVPKVVDEALQWGEL